MGEVIRLQDKNIISQADLSRRIQEQYENIQIEQKSKINELPHEIRDAAVVFEGIVRARNQSNYLQLARAQQDRRRAVEDLSVGQALQARWLGEWQYNVRRAYLASYLVHAGDEFDPPKGA